VLRIVGGRPLRGRVRVPPDLEVAQRALFFAALAEGRSELLGLPVTSSLASTIELLRALGVPIATGETTAVEGVGLSGLTMPRGALDCGAAWTSLALTAGVLSAQRFGTRITVDRTLAQRSVEHLVGPLRARGGQITAQTGTLAGRALTPPLSVAPLVEGEALRALDCSLPRADPAAKSGVLFSALFAAGPTTLAEPTVSADHTERMMVALGLPLRRIGSVLAFDPSGWDRRIPAQPAAEMPGSTTLASYLCAVAQCISGSAIELEHAGVNPSRSGVLDVLRSWGAELEIRPVGEAAQREPIGSITLQRRRGVRGGVLGGEELVRARDELAAFALIARSSARGCQLYELDAIAPEDDPTWSELVHLLRVFDVSVASAPNCLRIESAPLLSEAPAGVRRYDARYDAELALAAAALALASPGESVLEHAIEPLERSYPGFVQAARALGAEIQSV
jgi:3-phosphoshikimate 1-carboxyvinyltransferase